MWAGPRAPGGTYDVDDSVTALVRTKGPVLTVHGAWAQNIGESETYIDFMGDKAGIRLQYGGGFTLYTVEDGALVTYKPDFPMSDMFQNEIDSFVRLHQDRRKAAQPHRHRHRDRADDAGHLRLQRAARRKEIIL
jgi:predicted dehydrogenase